MYTSNEVMVNIEPLAEIVISNVDGVSHEVPGWFPG
ncbi:hypothetical protein J2S60_001642 [Gleimia europaea]|nr:hypothetical protein [Gleimia europaea]